jgi:hypothetical protein
VRSGEGSNAGRSRKKGPSRAESGYRIAYKPLDDSTPEVELAALAAVYTLVLQAHERNKAAASIDEDGKEVDTTRRPGQGRQTLAKGDRSCPTG